MKKIRALFLLAAFSFAVQLHAIETNNLNAPIENNTDVSGDNYRPKDMQEKIIQMQKEIQEIRAKVSKITTPEEMQKTMREQMIMLQKCLTMLQIMQNHIIEMEMTKQ